MRQTIWKFPLDITDEQVIFVPEGAAPLHVGAQDGVLCLWILVDTTARFDEQTIRIYGTGNPIGSEGRNECHVGSTQMGPYVWHVFWALP